MSTTLYFNNTLVDWSRGEGDADLIGVTRNWTVRGLTYVRGSAAATIGLATSVTGTTPGVEANAGADTAPYEWISEPLDRDVTISGNVFANLWGLEASMNANAGIGCIFQRLDSKGAVVSTIADTASSTELGTSAGLKNVTTTPTSTAMKKGDRIRARVYFGDAAGATMASGYTLTFRGASPTSAADGDSYVVFSEDFGFLQESPVGDLTSVSTDTGGQPIGGTTGNTQAAQPVRAGADGTVTSIDVGVWKAGAPTDDFVVALQADSGGSPSGTDLATASITGTSLSTTPTQTAFNIADTAVTGGAMYWIICRRTGGIDGTNFYRIRRFGTYSGRMLSWNGSGWFDPAAGSAGFVWHFTGSSSVLYLTDTASAVDPNGATYDAKEAWTSRGGGVQSGTTHPTANGPIAPLLATVASPGNFLEWFSKPLTAFTLSGLVAVNVRAKEGNVACNGAVRVEIAVCATDGTSPVVWGAANDGEEIGTSEAAMTFFVAGDDTAITNGQRLRIRVFFDDAPGLAVGAAGDWTLYYAGTSASASGDTYVVLPQTVTEYVTSAPIPPKALVGNFAVERSYSY